MSDTLGKGKASQAEQDKLIEEMQRLIKEKGLDVKLEAPKPSGALKGCSTCTVCPCTICW